MRNGRRYCYRDVLPFTTMVTMECVTVAVNTLFKAATLRGIISCHVFIAYAYAIAALLLLPSPFFSHRSRVLPPLNFSIICKICLLGLIGYTAQIMGYAGINYSSPTLSSAISNLIPAFTFVLAIIFRMEKVALRSSSSQAKIIGTIVSILGALVVVLYKGPPVILTSFLPILLRQPLHSPYSDWVIGGLFLATQSILAAMWYIVLVSIMKEYPAELTVVFFYNLSVSILGAIVGLITEPDLNAWRIRLDIVLLSIICSGILGSFLNNVAHTWALHLKGPVYVAMFKPLSIAIAVAMGVMFLGDTLYLGSVAGATIIAIGFYTVLWGKAKEDMGDDSEIGNLESPSTHKIPLLHSYKSRKTEAGHIRLL